MLVNLCQLEPHLGTDGPVVNSWVVVVATGRSVVVVTVVVAAGEVGDVWLKLSSEVSTVVVVGDVLASSPLLNAITKADSASKKVRSMAHARTARRVRTAAKASSRPSAKRAITSKLSINGTSTLSRPWTVCKLHPSCFLSRILSSQKADRVVGVHREKAK